MNVTIRGRLWQLLIRREALPSFARGTYPHAAKHRLFRWWNLGYWHVRRFYIRGEYNLPSGGSPPRDRTPDTAEPR